jgi:hypothetical protein
VTRKAELLASGRIFDFVLAVILLELLGFLGYRWLRHGHLVATEVYPNLLTAAGLLGAARLVIAGVWWGYACLLLIGALASHLCALKPMSFKAAAIGAEATIRCNSRRHVDARSALTLGAQPITAARPALQGLRRNAPSALSRPPVST